MVCIALVTHGVVGPAVLLLCGTWRTAYMLAMYCSCTANGVLQAAAAELAAHGGKLIWKTGSKMLGMLSRLKK